MGNQHRRDLAVAALMDNKRAAIIDADQQGSILNWVERREPPAPKVFPLKGTIAATIKTIMAGKPDYIIIDTPPSVSSGYCRSSRRIRLGTYHHRTLSRGPTAIGSSVQVVKAAKKRGGIILNRTSPRASALVLARGALEVFQLPICPTSIIQRVAHPYAASNGLTASEWEPDGSAAQEIEQVSKWVRAQLNG